MQLERNSVLVFLGGALVFTADPRATSGLGWFPEFHPASWLLIVACAVVLIFFLTVRRPFLARKAAFDKSGIPQLVRLSTFPDAFGTSAETIVPTIESFAREGGAAGVRQFVITGAPGSGRSSLAKSIGGDATAQRRKVRFLSAGRLIEKRRAGSEPVSAPGQPYAVAEADLVIIDDLSADLLAALGQGEAGVRALVDAPHSKGLSIFELAPLAADGKPLSDPRPLPQLVWVIDDRSSAANFHAVGLAARFPGIRIEKIDLSGQLSARRAAQKRVS